MISSYVNLYLTGFPYETLVCKCNITDNWITCRGYPWWPTWWINSYSASHDNWCTVGGDGGCRVGEVRAGTTSPMPDHKGFKLQQLVNFQKFSTLRVNIHLLNTPNYTIHSSHKWRYQLRMYQASIQGRGMVLLALEEVMSVGPILKLLKLCVKIQ